MWTVSLEGGPRRVNHAAVALGDRIYSFGGYCSGESMDTEAIIDIHVLNTVTNRWELVKPPSGCNKPNFNDGREDNESDSARPRMPFRTNPYQRYGHTVCEYKGKAYLWGGRNDDYGASQRLHEFDPETSTWMYVPTEGIVPPARDGHSAVVVGDAMYLFGGFEEDQQRFSQETYIFDFTTRRWSELQTAGTPPAWRDFHTAVAIKSKMYIFGGRSDQTGQYHSSRDIYCDRLKVLDLDTLQWSDPVTKGTKPCGRRSHSAWVYNGKMYLFGGYYGTTNTHYNDLHSYDPATHTWDKLEPTALVDTPSARRRQCTVLVGDKVYLFGGTTPIPGSNGGLSDLADLYVLDYSPKLFDLAARRVVNLYKPEFYKKILPVQILQDIDWMTKPNLITTFSIRHDMAG